MSPDSAIWGPLGGAAGPAFIAAGGGEAGGLGTIVPGAVMGAAFMGSPSGLHAKTPCGVVMVPAAAFGTSCLFTGSVPLEAPPKEPPSCHPAHGSLGRLATGGGNFTEQSVVLWNLLPQW